MITTVAVDAPRPAACSGDALRDGMRSYPTGVVLVAAAAGGRPVGMIANSFTSVSLDPPLVSLNFMRTSGTWVALQAADVWGISVLPDDRPDLIASLARGAADRFDGVDLLARPDGGLTLPDSPLTLVVERHADVDAGDHILTLLRVLEVHRDPARTAMVLQGRQQAA